LNMIRCTFNQLAVGFLLTVSIVSANKGTEENRWINVSGIGVVKSAPDVAVLRLGVQTIEQNAKLSTEKNNQSMNRIFEVLEEEGIGRDDFETENFNITPERQYRKGGAPLIVGYKVTNSLVIRIYELGKVGVIMQAAIEAGGNHFQSLTFGMKNDNELIDRARIRAMKDALKKAEILAGAVNAKVGKPMTIQELSIHQPPVHGMRMMGAEAMMDSVPVQGPSELITEIRVQVKFQLN
jgi:uncharacterized protein YggE